jgi:hypothetical protein
MLLVGSEREILASAILPIAPWIAPDRGEKGSRADFGPVLKFPPFFLEAVTVNVEIIALSGISIVSSPMSDLLG